MEHSCGKKVSDKQALWTLRFVLAVDDVARIRRPSAVEGESGQTMATFAGNSKVGHLCGVSAVCVHAS